MLTTTITLALVASASAFELPAAATRRAVLRAAAIAPLAAVAPAFADANNEMYGTGINVPVTGITDSYSNKGTRYNTKDSKLITDTGAGAQPTALYGVQGATKAPPRNVAGVRIGGKYSDPMHPGCARKVTLIGSNKVLIEGADEDGKKWTVRGTYEGKDLVLDFTPKGGPKDLAASYSLAGGLKFPDGNAWKKI